MISKDPKLFSFWLIFFPLAGKNFSRKIICRNCIFLVKKTPNFTTRFFCESIINQTLKIIFESTLLLDGEFWHENLSRSHWFITAQASGASQENRRWMDPPGMCEGVWNEVQSEEQQAQMCTSCFWVPELYVQLGTGQDNCACHAAGGGIWQSLHTQLSGQPFPSRETWNLNADYQTSNHYFNLL